MSTLCGTPFENYVWLNSWRRYFPLSQGWTIEPQKLLAGRYRVDFAAWQGNLRAVGDAKDKARLTLDDVEKLLWDAGIFKAQDLYLFIAGDTNISDSVWNYADRNGIEIVQTRWRS